MENSKKNPKSESQGVLILLKESLNRTLHDISLCFQSINAFFWRDGGAEKLQGKGMDGMAYPAYPLLLAGNKAKFYYIYFVLLKFRLRSIFWNVTFLALLEYNGHIPLHTSEVPIWYLYMLRNDQHDKHLSLQLLTVSVCDANI